MDELVSGFATPTWMPYPAIAARLMLATLAGAAIGFEREARNRPAGLRTHILVCLAAAIVAILTIEIVHAPFFAGASIQIDPIRLIEAVTAGVAFLAAGTIIVARGKVRGLTTGAGMWLAGVVGLCCGLGYWTIALSATVLAIIVLGLLHRLEDAVHVGDSAKEPGRPGASTPD